MTERPKTEDPYSPAEKWEFTKTEPGKPEIHEEGVGVRNLQIRIAQLEGWKCNYNMNRAWYCTQTRYHRGPCALLPRWWNFQAKRMMKL